MTLWWNTGTHAAREEVEVVELATTFFEMRTTCLLIAGLGTLKDFRQTLEMAFAVGGVKRQRVNQTGGGVANLRQSDRWVFPPATAPFGGIRTNDLPS